MLKVSKFALFKFCPSRTLWAITDYDLLFSFLFFQVQILYSGWSRTWTLRIKVKAEIMKLFVSNKFVIISLFKDAIDCWSSFGEDTCFTSTHIFSKNSIITFNAHLNVMNVVKWYNHFIIIAIRLCCKNICKYELKIKLKLTNHLPLQQCNRSLRPEQFFSVQFRLYSLMSPFVSLSYNTWCTSYSFHFLFFFTLLLSSFITMWDNFNCLGAAAIL